MDSGILTLARTGAAGGPRVWAQAGCGAATGRHDFRQAGVGEVPKLTESRPGGTAAAWLRRKDEEPRLGHRTLQTPLGGTAAFKQAGATCWPGLAGPGARGIFWNAARGLCRV